MSEDKTIKSVSTPSTPNSPSTSSGASTTVAKDLYGSQKRDQGGAQRGGRNNNRGHRGRDNRPKDDFEQRILDIARVTRVMAGGKRMSFRACVAIGDKKGSVGVALGKGSDVTIAINKAVVKAKKNLVKVPIVKATIPHSIFQKLGAAKIILKPAKEGRGIISGGVTRVILELSGIKNITSKNLGSKSKINNARCVIKALSNLKHREAKDDKKKETESKFVENKELKIASQEIKK